MSAEEESNVTTLSNLSHQSLRKAELRVLTQEFEQRTRDMLTELERSDLPELKRRLIGAQLGRRCEFLARLQAMGLTATPNDWAFLYETWKEVMHGH